MAITNYALDTDTLSLFESGHLSVVQRVLNTPPDQLMITAITVRERLDGWYGLFGRIKTDEDEARIYDRLVQTTRICASLRILPYDLAAIRRFRQLQALKLNVRPMDLRVAVTALENDVVLVTRNTRDFGRIPDLIIENWA